MAYWCQATPAKIATRFFMTIPGPIVIFVAHFVSTVPNPPLRTVGPIVYGYAVHLDSSIVFFFSLSYITFPLMRSKRRCVFVASPMPLCSMVAGQILHKSTHHASTIESVPPVSLFISIARAVWALSQSTKFENQTNITDAAREFTDWISRCYQRFIGKTLPSRSAFDLFSLGPQDWRLRYENSVAEVLRKQEKQI